MTFVLFYSLFLFFSQSFLKKCFLYELFWLILLILWMKVNHLVNNRIFIFRRFGLSLCLCMNCLFSYFTITFVCFVEIYFTTLYLSRFSSWFSPSLLRFIHFWKDNLFLLNDWLRKFSFRFLSLSFGLCFSSYWLKRTSSVFSLRSLQIYEIFGSLGLLILDKL
jgi:hypothetical protein